MSQGQTERIAELREQLKKATAYTYLWYRIACELAGKDAVDAEFQRIMAEGGYTVKEPEPEMPRVLTLNSRTLAL
jgi:hypothetical protein